MTEEEAFQSWWQNEWKFGSSTDETKARRAWVAARTARIMSRELDELTIERDIKSDRPETGIFVRAKDALGRWQPADIGTLDKESLLAWLRSRGGTNEWAENTVLLILGHDLEHD